MILQWELAADEFETFIIELILTVIVLFTLIILLVIWKRYKKLTKKGFPVLFVGYALFALHIVFDFLDTLALKEINGQPTTIYLIFDYLDAILSFIGLFMIGFGFYAIARYGMEIWRGEQ
jgi:uncharacterized membrane protein